MFVPRHAIFLVLGMGLLAACGRGDPQLRDLNTNRGEPEEFSIVPNKPLTQPDSYAQLPPPTPGGANRTDQTPEADAVAVLGGDPSRLTRGAGVPASDAALVGAATRYGVNGNIRTDLRQEDVAFRKRRSLFNWQIVQDDKYPRAYRPQRLDADAELERWRRAGARTPSAPPEAN